MDSLRIRAAVLAALLVLPVACSGGGGGDETAGPSEEELEVIAVDFAFEPDAWTIPADTDVSVTLVNEGQVEHEWAVLTEGTRISSESEFEEDLVELEIEATPSGESATETVNLPAGTYQVICALAGHFNSGMEGELTVR
jgi:uncharacterized cupredoxin-like copper-binding protein